MNSEEEKIVLIVDKIGNFGASLAHKLLETNNKVILCSSHKALSFAIKSSHFKHIQIKKRIPTIPNYLFSQIFVVFNNEKEITAVLPSLLRKAKHDGVRFFLLLYYKNYSPQLKKLITVIHSKASIVLIGDILSEDERWDSQLFFQSEGRIRDMVKQMSIHKKIVLSSMGTNILRPVFLPDILNQLLGLNYEVQSSETIFLFSFHPITELTFVRYIKQIFPTLKIDFISNSKIITKEQTSLPEDGRFLISGHNFKNQLNIVIKNLLKDMEIENESKDYENKKEKQKSFLSSFVKPFKNIFLHLFLICLSILVVPVFLSACFLLLGVGNLNTAKEYMEKGDVLKSKNAVASSKNFLKIGREFSTLAAIEANLLGIHERFLPFFKTIDASSELTSALELVFSASDKITAITQAKSNNPKDDFLDALNSLRKTHETLQQINASFNGTFLDSSLKEVVGKAEKPLGLLVSMADVLPEVLGFNQEKLYLILFQNNTELRPGGGFIGSFGLAKVENLVVKDFKIYNVYDADGQLKGHVEPPFPVRRYLPSVHWYLRDSNYNIDFQKSADDALFFLDKQLQIQADAVIGLDTSFIKDLLSITGPVYVVDYQETVSSKNAYALIQSHSEKNSFASSTQKADFLAALSDAIREKLFSESSFSYSAISTIVLDAIDRKHLAVYIKDPSIQRYFTVNNMSSSLWDEREKARDKINDYFAINEANLGVNKVNLFVNRKIEQLVNIEKEGNVFEEVTITFNNSAKSQSSGNYKNYLRFITPLGSTLRKISINGAPVPFTQAITDPNIYEKKGFIPPSELEVEEYNQDEKTVFGFLVTILPGTSKKVTLIYDLARRTESLRTELTYDLIYFKQMGIESSSHAVRVNFPSEYKVLSVSNQDGYFNIKGPKSNSMSLLKDISTNTHIILRFTRK